MLVTLGIMSALLAIAIPVFLSSRAHTRRSDADNSVRAALLSARESAIRRRTVVAVEFVSGLDPQRGDLMVIVDKSKSARLTDVNQSGSIETIERIIGQPIALPDFIKFDIDKPSEIPPVVGWSTLATGWNGDPLDTFDDVTDPPLVAGAAAPNYPDIAFLPDGSLADPEGTTDIVMYDTTESNAGGQQVRQWLRALPATGMMVEVWHLQDPSQPESATNPRNKGWL